MYRKPSGGYGVSFTRFMNNAAPSFMFDSSKDPGHITMPQKDSFYLAQMGSPDPYAFNELSLMWSGIIDNETVSRKGFKGLQKSGALNAQGNVDTTKIGPKFTHDMAVISAFRQKQIIDLLFWWEEECHRLRKLQDERTELTALKESAQVEVARNDVGGGDQERLDHLILLLNRVETKIRQKPSERTEAMERDEDELIMNTRTGTATTTTPRTVVTDEAPPAYEATAQGA